MVKLTDGTGSGQEVGVSPTGNRLNVSSRSDDRIYYISRDNGDAYATTSIDSGAVAGEYSFYFKNTSSTQKFYVSSISVGSAELAIFKLSSVTGTATGTDITPVNTNLTTGNVASAEVKGNGAVAGLTEASLLGITSVQADSSKIIGIQDSLILGLGDAIAIEYDTGAGAAVHVGMLGFFDSE